MSTNKPTRPTVADLCILLNDLVQWEAFAIQLPGIASYHIQAIEYDNDVEDKKRALYEAWMSVYPDASWEDVIKALERAKLNFHAKNVRKTISNTSVHPFAMSLQQQEEVVIFTVSATPTVADLYTLLDYLVDWQGFALHLPGIILDHVRTIEEDKHGDIKGQKIILYQKWLEVCPDASWEDVIKALEKVRQHTIAEKLRKATLQPISPQQQKKLLSADPKNVCMHLNSISYDWDNIALHLKVPFGFRQQLKKDPMDNDRKLVQVIHKWYQSACSEVSWNKIIEVLEHLNYTKTVCEIENDLLTNSDAKYNWSNEEKQLHAQFRKLDYNANLHVQSSEREVSAELVNTLQEPPNDSIQLLPDGKCIYTVTGLKPRFFNWQDKKYFSVEIPAGIVAPGNSCDITVAPISPKRNCIFPSDSVIVSEVFEMTTSCAIFSNQSQ